MLLVTSDLVRSCKMKIELFEVDGAFGGASVTWVKIDHGNDEYTTMPKELYDAIQAEQSTPIVTADE